MDYSARSVGRVDRIAERYAARIQQVHCRLLESATHGRLTWAGDRIVSRGTEGQADVDERSLDADFTDDTDRSGSSVQSVKSVSTSGGGIAV